MLDRTEDRVPDGDVAFDGDALRAGCPDRGTHAVVPNEANWPDPRPCRTAAYRERNRVERLFAEREPFRRAATRGEKPRATLLGMVPPALGSIRPRKSANVNTPQDSHY